MRLSWSWLTAILVAAAVLHVPAAAQDAPHHRQAREIFARLIAFRTAAGHGQVPAMANYIAETLRAGGVPAEDIADPAARRDGGDAGARSGSRRRARGRSCSPAIWTWSTPGPRTGSAIRSTLIEESGYLLRPRHRRQQGRNRFDGLDDPADARRRPSSRAHPGLRLHRRRGNRRWTTTSLVAAHDWVRNAEFAINTDAGGGTLSRDGRPMTYGVQGAEKTYASFQRRSFAIRAATAAGRAPTMRSTSSRRRCCVSRRSAFRC